MKKLIFTLSLFLSSYVAFGQNCYFSEDLEVIDSVSSTGTPGFNANSTYFHSGLQSTLGTYAQGDEAVLTTSDIDFATPGYSFVILKFWHICKMEFFDQGIVQVSNDGGASWVNLTGNEYLGSAPFGQQGNKFVESSYPTWQPGNAGALPDSTWWKQETFDISALVGLSPNAKVRWVAKDLNNSGMGGRLGWLIDDICIESAPCEIFPPVITQLPPVLSNTIYNLGPYDLNLNVTDQSGLAAVYIFYTVNGVGPNVIPMINPLGDSVYTGQIPGVNHLDTVCYYFYAQDASNCANEAYYPAFVGGVPQPICFVASSGITFPYCDDFDVNNLWSASSLSGSVWELGAPNYGPTSTAHSAPNAWDIVLNGPYVQASESYLTSPVFDFATSINCRLSFWYNSATTANFDEDGVYLEYSQAGGPWTLLDVALDPSAVNWYNLTNIAGTGQPGWGGNSNGWTQAGFNLSAFDASTGGVKFRFVFKSAAFSTGDGFSIDDLCIIQPPPTDMGVDQIKQPFATGGGGQTSNAIIRVRNYGTVAVPAFDCYYTIDGGATIVGPTAYAGAPLAPNDTAVITMPTFVIPNGQFDFCAWVVTTGDAYTPNDTMCIASKGIPVIQLTYCNDFDVNGNDWTDVTTPGSATLWELGTPAFGATSSAFSAPNSWDVNLNSAYGDNANAILLSPFFDFTPVINVDLSFYINYNTEGFWDGARLQYSLNAGPWTDLASDGIATNWYNGTINSANGDSAWQDNSNGWVKATKKLSQFNNAGNVQFQFVFTSDGVITVDGFSMDNFCLRVPLPDDIGVDAIISPGSNSGANTLTDMTVRVRNFGLNTISAFDLYYDLGAGPQGPFAYSGPPIVSNGTEIVTIPPQFLPPVGSYCFKAYTSLAIDQDNTNDTTAACSFGVPVDTLNYCDDFDGGAIGWQGGSDPSGVNTWELGTPAFGATNSAHSAPNSWDINLNTAYQGMPSNTYAYLYSPFIDFSNATNVNLFFWINFDTENNWDGVRLEYSVAGGAWTILNPGGAVNWYTGNLISGGGQPGWEGSSNGWIRAECNLSQFNNIGLVQFRYAFSADGVIQNSGVSIDDFCAKIPPPFDAGVTSIDGPIQQGLQIGAPYTLTVTIRNFGQNIISNFPVSYTINGGGVQTTMYGGSLAPNASATINLTPNFNAITGQFNICAYTSLTNDGDATNDTSCTFYVGVPTITPTYVDDFDGPNAGWTVSSATASSKWEYGVPAFGATASSYSPPNCWDVNLTTITTPNANCELISPYFDFTNVVKGELSFYLNYKTDQFDGDGMHVEYSTDGGNNWAVLGAVGSPQSNNWYTTANIFSSNTPGWSGTGFWQQAFFKDVNGDMDGFNNVRFKFVYTTDGFTTSDGVSVDDIKVYRPIPNTAASVTVEATNGVLQPGMQMLTATLKNSGYIPLQSVSVTLRIDGNIICTDNINPTPVSGGVLFDSTWKHTFSCLWNASPGAHDVCVYTSFPNQIPDEFPDDDTACAVLTVFDTVTATTGGYCNDFETGPTWVALNTTTFANVNQSWQLGSPTKTILNGPHGGANCWATKLTGDYPNLDQSSLYTPVFNIEQGRCYEMRFWHNFDMDLFNDGGLIEFSVDSAKTWRTFGDFGDQLNWYNAIYIAAVSGVTPAFTGTYGAWVESVHEYKSTATGTIMFRFRFASDQTNTAEGWAIDDFCFKQQITPCVLTGVAEQNGNGWYLNQNTPNPANGLTTINYSITKSGKTILTVTDLLGKQVATLVNATLDAGKHSITLKSTDFAPGIYYYTLENDGNKLVRKMVVTE
jgi:hypothetical protein